MKNLCAWLASVLLCCSSALAADANHPASEAATLFQRNCSSCHGSDGKGVASIGTPDFTAASLQASISDKDVLRTIRNGSPDGRMPAWSGKLSDSQMALLATHVRGFGSETNTGVYQPGDDFLFSLPTGRPLARNELDINFSHRFPDTPTFTGPAKAAVLFGLDDFAVPSFGIRYGVTDRLSLEAMRSPSIIGRPIQVRAAYNLLDENRGRPFNLAVAFSLEGQDNFRKNYSTDLEILVSRSITKRAQLYFVPTFSFNDRPLLLSGFTSDSILNIPGVNAVSLGMGVAVDVRPTVALVAEVIPTVHNGRELGIHRPAYSFGVQKKIYRHAFTLGFTNSPGITTSQRAATRATYLNDPGADRPSGLFVGFDLTRRVR